jgi:hypothetical protein
MANLETFLQELLGSYLPGYSTEEGGVLHQRIIQPVLERVGEGALTTDVNDFLKARLLEEFPQAATEAGDAITDILIHAAGLFFEAYRVELAQVAASQKLSGALTLDDATALAANWYVSPITGVRATTFVRAEFARPTTFGSSTNIAFTTRDALNFFPAETIDYTAFSMLDNVLPNGNYYVDILVVAEEVGSQYNVAEKAISVVSGIPNVVAVYNLSKVENGVDADTAATLSARIPKAINERSLVTAPGVVARVTSRLDNVANVQVIGFKDPEMHRDEVTTTASADTFAFGAFVAYDRNILVNVMGNEKPAAVGDKIQLHYPDPVYSVENRLAPETFTILDVVPLDQVLPAQIRYLLFVDGTPSPTRTTDPILPDGLLIGFCKLQKTPTVVTNIDDTVSVYPSGKVHFGGHSDAYISTYVDNQATNTLTSHTRGFQGTGFSVPANPQNVVQIENVAIPPHLLVAGNTFKVSDGDLEGTYTIAFASVNGNIISISLKDTLVTGDYADIDWEVLSSIEINLFNPSKVKLPYGQIPFTVSTSVGNPVVTCSQHAADFGAAVGDTLRILSTNIAGDYEIRVIDGLQITLSRNMAETHADISAEIISLEVGILRPLTQVSKVVIDDYEVPYGKPLLVEVKNIGGARELFVDGSGCIFPAVQACLPTNGAGDVVDVVVPSNYVSTNGNERSYSADADLPDRVILTLENWQGGVNSDFTQEIFIPDNVWQQGRRNNIYVATGNISYSDLDTWINTYFGFREIDGDGYQEPVEALPANWRTDPDACPIPLNLPDPAPVGRGDILTVNMGPNKGSYIVEDSYLLNFNFGTVAAPRRLPIRIIRIQGEFPSDPFSGLLDAFDTIQPSKAGKSTLNFGDALRMFLSPQSMLSAFKVNELTVAINASWQINFGMFGPTTPNLLSVLNVLRARIISNYSCGKPAVGSARVYFQNPVTFELQAAGLVRETAFTLASPPPPPARVRSLANPLEYAIDYVESSSISQDDSSKLTWRRDLSVSHEEALGGVPARTLSGENGDCTIDTSLQEDIRLDGRDVLAICEQVHGVLLPELASTEYKGLGVVATKSGSNRVTWQPTLNEDFPYSLEDVGALFFLESGPDKGGYTITSVDAATKSIILNSSMTYTTPAVRTKGKAVLTTQNTLTTTAGLRAPNDTDVGKYITIYNGRVANATINRQANVGTFEIISVTPVGLQALVEFDGEVGTDYLLDAAVGDTYCSWVITETPSTEILDLTDGYKECVGQIDYMVYDSNPTRYYLYEVWAFDDYPRVLRFRTLDGESPNGSGVFDTFNFRNPYRLIREGQFLITSAEMALNVEGPVYYADLPIRSIGFQESCNTPEKICDISHYRCEGYRMRTDSYKSSFSVYEGAHLILPPKFTPPDQNYFETSVPTAEVPVQITYKYCVDVSVLQAIMDNYGNRVMCASLLSRRMLPAEVGLNITYTSGVDEVAMKKVVSDFLINSFATRNVLSVSSLVSTMYSSGASHVVLPFDIMYIVEDLNRDRFLRKSQDALRYVDVGYYEGTARITHWNPSDTMIVLSRNSAARNLGV